MQNSYRIFYDKMSVEIFYINSVEFFLNSAQLNLHKSYRIFDKNSIDFLAKSCSVKKTV